MRFLIILISVFTCALSGMSQFQLETYVSNDSITVGQPSKFILNLTVPSDIDTSLINWNLPKDSLGTFLQIISTKGSVSKEKQNVILSKEIKFRGEEFGIYSIASIAIDINGDLINTDEHKVFVYTTVMNPMFADINESKESIEVTYTFWDWLFENKKWILLGIVLFLLTAAAVILLVRRKNPQQIIEEAPQEPAPIPFEVAMNKIKTLEVESPWTKGKDKVYHSSISYITREYLEGELHISGLESTTTEILADLKQFELPESILSDLKVLLSLTDLVKFAKRKPTDLENEQTLEKTKKVIIHINQSTDKLNSQ